MPTLFFFPKIGIDTIVGIGALVNGSIITIEFFIKSKLRLLIIVDIKL